MVRSRRRAELSESWDDMGYDHEDNERIYTEEDERREMRGSHNEHERNARIATPRRSSRLSAEPELVMPSSPDASGARLRTSTPHFRLKDRSMTSDAGKMGREAKLRASTPHFRLNQRSMTSDAGRFGSLLKDEEEEDEGEEDAKPQSSALWTLWIQVLRPTLAYALDILGIALGNMKPLLGYALLLYILIGAAVFGMGFLTNTVNNALSPICRIPGASYLNLPFCPLTGAAYSSGDIQAPAEFDKLVTAQSQFEDVLQSAQVGANLPMDMKRSEASIRDLKHVVQYSTLPSRNELVFEFAGFIDTARQASQDLSKFNSHIGRAVDHILSTNRWTLSTIAGAQDTVASTGAIARWLNIFAIFQPVDLSTHQLLLDQYLRHTSAVEEQILRLITEAQALLNILDNLDNRLDLISSIAVRDGIHLQSNADDLLATLWTKLGGNRQQKAKFESQLSLLKEVGAYRRLAWAHITATIVKLQAIRDHLEDLRERVAMPETIGTDAVPLEVHVENINLGIERLEAQREAGRRAEADGYAKILSRAEDGERRMIGEAR